MNVRSAFTMPGNRLGCIAVCLREFLAFRAIVSGAFRAIVSGIVRAIGSGMFRAILSVMVSLMLGLSGNALAQGVDSAEPQFNVIQLNAQAEAEVANDLMSVNLVARVTGSDPAQLADQVNANMGWAIAKLKAFRSINSRTLDYQTYPEYERNRTQVKGWIASQTLHIESDDFEQTSKAIQVLQERLQVQGMQLTAKPETRKKIEDQLINTALNAFKQRAVLVQTNMGAPGFKIKNLSINSNGSNMPHRGNQNYRAEATSSLVGSAPVIEGGTSTVTVTINGQIQLQ